MVCHVPGINAHPTHVDGAQEAEGRGVDPSNEGRNCFDDILSFLGTDARRVSKKQHVLECRKICPETGHIFFLAEERDKSGVIDVVRTV